MHLAESSSKALYHGFRPQDSLSLHEAFANKGRYPFSLPSSSLYMLIDITRQCSQLYRSGRSVGMKTGDGVHVFDSYFEGGNLDVAAKGKGSEYDLYVRTDSNARGHHQWFYFSVQAKARGTVRFNIVNLTQRDSLYTQGMRIAICTKDPSVTSEWRRGGENIVYKPSKIPM